MNPVTSFNAIRDDLLQINAFTLPSLTIKSLGIVHWLWWISRKKKLLTKENIIPAALGTALDFSLPFTPSFIEKPIRGIAKIILIATRIDETINKLNSFNKSFDHLKKALTHEHPEFIEPKWTKYSNSLLFSTTFQNHFLNKQNQLKAYFKRLYFCTMRLFVKLFKLSMHLWDTYHAITLSHDDVPLLFINGKHWYQKICAQPHYLSDRLDRYSGYIWKILKNTGLNSKEARNLIQNSKNVFKLIDSSVERTQQLQKFTENLLTSCKKTSPLPQTFSCKTLYQDLDRPLICAPLVLNTKVS